MSHHRTLTINLARIILAAGVALPASFGTSLAAAQPSLEDITLRTPRATRGLSGLVYASKFAVDAVELARRGKGAIGEVRGHRGSSD